MRSIEEAEYLEICSCPTQLRHIALLAEEEEVSSNLARVLCDDFEIYILQNTRYVERRDSDYDTYILQEPSCRCLRYSPSDASNKTNHGDFLLNIISNKARSFHKSELYLKATDGSILCVSCQTGLTTADKILSFRVLSDSVQPLVVLYDMESLLRDKKSGAERIYQTLCNVLKHINEVSQAFKIKGEAVEIDPRLGNVIFASSSLRWTFSLQTFARIYSTKQQHFDISTLNRKLWGDNYFDRTTQTWSEKTEKSEMRIFCAFVLEPIMKLLQAIDSTNTEQIVETLNSLDICLDPNEITAPGDKLFEKSMRLWLNGVKALLDSCVRSLPSPVEAQSYRWADVYHAPFDDECSTAIRNCKGKGPLMIRLFDRQPTCESRPWKNALFGRVYSGCTNTASTLTALFYDSAGRSKRKSAAFRFGSAHGTFLRTLSQVSAGMLINITSHSNIERPATITNNSNAHDLYYPPRINSPCLKYIVKFCAPFDYSRLVNAIIPIMASNSYMALELQQNGDAQFLGKYMEDIDTILSTLPADLDVKISEASIIYKESITSSSSRECKGTSPNRHNSLYLMAEPITDDVIDTLNECEDDLDKAKELLASKFKWKDSYSDRVWAIGDKKKKAWGNLLVNSTTQENHYLHEIRDSVVDGWNRSVTHGVLTGEKACGVCYSILEYMLHSDAIHRGAGQIIPAIRKACWLAQLAAQPVLLEPLYIFMITCLGLQTKDIA